MVQFVEKDPLLGLGLFALADIDQHIDRPDYLASAIAKRCRIWDERNPGAIGALGHYFRVADGTTLFKSDCHWALVIRERRPVRMVQFPGDAPFAAGRRGVAHQFRSSLIEVSNLALRVSRVDRRRDGRNQLLELMLTVAEPSLGDLQRSRSLGHALLERIVELAQLLLGVTPRAHFSHQGAVYLFEISLLSIELCKNPDLRAENGRIHRFLSIIDCARLVAFENVLIVIVIGGQKDDRHASGLLTRLDHLGQLKSCHSRHADVENEESKFVSEQRKQRLFSGLGPNQPVTGSVQDRLEDGQIFRLVVNDQDVDGRLYGQHASCGSSDFRLAARIEVVSSRRPNRNNCWSPGIEVTLTHRASPLTTCLEPRRSRGRHIIAATPVKIAFSTYANFGWYDNRVSNASHFQRNSHTRISDNSWSVFTGLEM